MTVGEANSSRAILVTRSEVVTMIVTVVAVTFAFLRATRPAPSNE